MSNPTTSIGRLRAAIYEQRPNLFSGLRRTFSELLSIARTYVSLGKHDITQHAFTAIAQLLADYLKLRDGDLIMPTSFHATMGQTDFQFDPILTEPLEGLLSLHKGIIARGDVQLSQQITDALESLALQSINTRGLFSPPGENPTTAFIRAYMFGPIQEGALRGLDDITMNGARAMSNIATALLAKQFYLTAQTTIGDLEKLANISIIQRKPHVTGAPVRSLSQVLHDAVSEPVVRTHTIATALLALVRICQAEVQFKSAALDLSLKFALGPFLDLAEPTALANIEELASKNLIAAMEENNSGRTAKYRDAISELNEDLWEHLVAIGIAAAATESFALFYVNLNIGEITKHGLSLYSFLTHAAPKATDQASAHELWLHEQFTDKLLGEMRWIVGATYWRIFEALEPPINTNLVWEFFPTLADIGIRALDANAPSVAEAAITELKSIASMCIEKPIRGSFRSAARVAVFAARIGIIAQKIGQQEILNLSITALREFNHQYFAKQQQLKPDADSYEAVFLNELNKLKEEWQSQSWFLDAEDAAFFSRVTIEDLKTFENLFSSSL